MTEALLHQQVADYLALAIVAPDWWTTFPAGGGGKARGGQLKARGLKAGVPDVLVIREGGRAFWIELKTDKGRVSSAQVETGAALLRAGSPVAVCRSLDQVQDMLGHWGFALKARAA